MVGERALAVLELADALLDRVGDREAADDDVAELCDLVSVPNRDLGEGRAHLSDTVAAVERLLLDGVAPGEIHVDDVVGADL